MAIEFKMTSAGLEELKKELDILCAMDPDQLLEERYARFRKYGDFQEDESEKI